MQPDPATAPRNGTPIATTGFFGKIPSRGDFVRSGLPATTIAAWDSAISSLITSSKQALADRWPEVWLQAPVWRFALPSNHCGPESLLGLWLPSVDRAGRYFPLMIAATGCHVSAAVTARHSEAWLDAAEDAGRTAISSDLTPDDLAALIPPMPDLSLDEYPLGEPWPSTGAWWTDGSPLVPKQRRVLATMPDGAAFLTMLDAP